MRVCSGGFLRIQIQLFTAFRKTFLLGFAAATPDEVRQHAFCNADRLWSCPGLVAAQQKSRLSEGAGGALAPRGQPLRQLRSFQS